VNDLIAALVPTSQQAGAQSLLEDPGTRRLIRRQLSQMADDRASLVPQTSFNWILCKLSTFGADDKDTLRIYQAFLSQLNQLGQLCRLASGEGADLRFDSPAAVASRLTIGLGLFYEQAARRHQYHAAPSPQYYQRMAASCFALTGYKNIAAKLPHWLEFLRDNFVLPGMQ
jgi:hypothetical protein